MWCILWALCEMLYTHDGFMMSYLDENSQLNFCTTAGLVYCSGDSLLQSKVSSVWVCHTSELFLVSLVYATFLPACSTACLSSTGLLCLEWALQTGELSIAFLWWGATIAPLCRLCAAPWGPLHTTMSCHTLCIVCGAMLSSARHTNMNSSLPVWKSCIAQHQWFTWMLLMSALVHQAIQFLLRYCHELNSDV